MRTNKEIWKGYKKDIVVGVITSLLSSWILWFAGWVFETAPRIGANLPSTIENIIYTKAASVTEFTPFLLLLELISVAVMATVLFVIFMLATYKLRINNELAHDFKEMTANAELAKYKENAHTPKEKAVYKRKLRRRINAIEKEHRKTGVMLCISHIALILLIALILCMMVTLVQKPIELKEQFDLEIQIISPYVEESVITKLKSDWVLMYSKEQYLEIYETIDAILEDQGIYRYFWSTTNTILSGAENPVPTE